MDKVIKLREFLQKEGLSAFLVPHTDEFQGEYIAPSSERLKWLTGFSGSAGFAIITPEKTAFFTDGRYTLQAKEEVPAFYEQYDIMRMPPYKWVSENIPLDGKVGYDPWLFTENQLKSYQNPLIPLSQNPIDLLWNDRPSAPQDFIYVHSLDYAGEADEQKRKRIVESLEADCLLLTACDSIAWLLNIRGRDVPHTPLVHCRCLLKRDGTYDLFVDLDKVNAEAFNHFRKGGGRIISIHQMLSHLGKGEGLCQVDPVTTPIKMIQTLEDAGVKILRKQDPCVLPKALKNEGELKGAKHAHLQDGVALCEFLAWLDEQPLKGEVTELSAAEKLLEFRKKGEHFRDTSFETISGFAAHGAIIHYRVTPQLDSPLTRDGLYLVDSGGQYLTGTTDVTRTIALGTPTADQKDKYTRVLKGHIALAQAIFPENTTGAHLDVLARQFLWQAGCDYEHGTGHGVGSYLCVHEGPQSISKGAANVPLKPGMILSNEPGFYAQGAYGIRIESLVEVVEAPGYKGFYGFETLTLVPLDVALIDISLLTGSEKAWIQRYHEKIYRSLASSLNPSSKQWLKSFLKVF